MTRYPHDGHKSTLCLGGPFHGKRIRGKGDVTELLYLPEWDAYLKNIDTKPPTPQQTFQLLYRRQSFYLERHNFICEGHCWLWESLYLSFDPSTRGEAVARLALAHILTELIV